MGLAVHCNSEKNTKEKKQIQMPFCVWDQLSRGTESFNTDLHKNFCYSFDCAMVINQIRNGKRGLETWVGSSECWLLLQRAWVWLPEPTCHLATVSHSTSWGSDTLFLPLFLMFTLSKWLSSHRCPRNNTLWVLKPTMQLNLSKSYLDGFM